MANIDIHELAEQARKLGYSSKEQIINRLTRRIVRDQDYLARRHAMKRHTSHDDTAAEDMVVTALAIELLEQG